MTLGAQPAPPVVPGRRTGLFRNEALEHHARSSKPGKPLRSGDQFTTCGTPMVLVVLLASALAALIVPATQTVTGTVTGLARPGMVTLQFPATARADLRAGLAVENVAEPARLIEVEPGAGEVIATASCAADCVPGHRVTIVLDRGPVAAALVPSLRPLLGGGR
jgi:hypothetical protein